MKVSDSTLFVLFTTLMGMVLVWFVLVSLLFRRLATGHTRKYCDMGRPSLSLSSNATDTWALLKFLLAREHRGLGDRGLSRLSDCMLIFAIIYLVLLLWLGWAIFGRDP